MGVLQCAVCLHVFDSGESANCPECTRRRPFESRTSSARSQAEGFADPVPSPPPSSGSARGPMPSSKSAARGGWPVGKDRRPPSTRTVSGQRSYADHSTVKGRALDDVICVSCGSAFPLGLESCPACGFDAGSPNPVQSSSPVPTGQVRGDFYWTGTQWLMLSSPSESVAYFTRSIAMAVVAGIIGGFGLGIAAVTNGEAVAAFVIGGIISTVLLIVSVLSLLKGESALMSWSSRRTARGERRI